MIHNIARKLLTLVPSVGILFIGTLTLCFEWGAEAAPAPAEIVWGGPKNIAMLPIIAQQKGLFDRENLSAKSKYLQTGKITLDSVIRGDINFGVIVEATVAFAGFQNVQDLRIIAVNQEKLDDAIVARKDRGINTPADLVGKRLGVSQGTNSQMFAYRFLEANHINPKAVKIVNLSPPAIVAALNNGDLDAGSIWQPFRHYLNQQLGDKATNFENNGIYRGYALIAVKESWAKKHPELVDQFLKALIDAEEYAQQHQDEVVKLIAREIDLTPELLQELWGEYHLAVSMPPTLADVIAQEGRWIIANVNGFKGKPLPDYSSFLDSAPLKRISVERVR